MTAAEPLPEDPELPSLEALFDTDAMARRITAHLAALQADGAPRMTVIGCEIERVKYRPARNCVVGYRLRLQSSARRTAVPQRVCVALYAPAEAALRWAKFAHQQGTGAVRTGLPRVSLLQDLPALLWMFPNDRKLPALAYLADAAALRQLELPRLVALRWGAGWNIERVRTSIAGYFPEHSCTLRAQLYLRHALHAAQRVWTLYGHMRHDDAGEAVFTIMRRLWEAAPIPGAGFARPLAYDADRRILWQEGIGAPTLAQHLEAEPAVICWTALGRAVARMHATSLDLPERLTLAAVADAIGLAQGVVAEAVPPLRTEVNALAAELVARLPGLRNEACATVHGDLHSKNVLMGGERVYFIDLDRVARGVPLAELGSLLGEFVYRDCVAGRPVRWPPLWEIIDAYAHHVPWPVDDGEVAWHLAAALLRERAYRCVTSLKPGRLGALPRIIDTARLLLARGLPGRVEANAA